ncbi:MAG: MFS transporter [Bacteriovoracia bacterium]
MSSPTLRYSIYDGIAFSLMVGLGETYLAAFALALGYNDVVSGLITAAPLFTGALLQLTTPYGVRKLGSFKRWVCACVAAQGLSFLPFVVLGFLGELRPLPVFVLFFLVALYWAAGMASGPAWNTWMSTIIPKDTRVSFFSRRNWMMSAAVLTGILVGGVSLHAAGTGPWLLPTFALLFTGACLSRLLSAYFLTRQDEPKGASLELQRVPLRSLWRKIRTENYGKILLYLMCVQVGAQFSAPYFSPFILSHLQFSYAEFMWLVSASLLARMLTSPFVSRWTPRWGVHRLLLIAGIGIIPTPALLLLSQDIAWITLVQVTAGFFWAIYEFAAFLILFEEIPEKERTNILTTYNLFSTLAMLVGSVCGGWVLSTYLGSSQAYMIVFLTASTLRLLAIFALLSAGEIKKIRFKRLPLDWRAPWGLRPLQGSIARLFFLKAKPVAGDRAAPPAAKPDREVPRP